MRKKIHTILLAAGFSRRFEENKLLYPLDGKALYLYQAERLTALLEEKITDSFVVVTQYDEIFGEMRERKAEVIKNDNSIQGISSSVKLGLLKARQFAEKEKDNYYIFFVADQPYLRMETIKNFLKAFIHSGKSIGCVRTGDALGNPVIFHERYVPELESLEGDKGGKCVLKKHIDEAFFYSVEDERELRDIDTKGELS